MHSEKKNFLSWTSNPHSKKSTGSFWVLLHSQSIRFGIVHASRGPYLKKDKNEEWHLQLSYVLHVHQMYTDPHKHVYTYTDTQAVLYYTFCLVYLCGRARAEKEQNHIKIRDNGDNLHTCYYWDCWEQFLNLNLLIVTFLKKKSVQQFRKPYRYSWVLFHSSFPRWFWPLIFLWKYLVLSVSPEEAEDLDFKILKNWKIQRKQLRNGSTWNGESELISSRNC